jgi:hypothetical protein
LIFANISFQHGFVVDVEVQLLEHKSCVAIFVQFVLGCFFGLGLEIFAGCLLRSTQKYPCVPLHTTAYPGVPESIGRERMFRLPLTLKVGLRRMLHIDVDVSRAEVIGSPD